VGFGTETRGPALGSAGSLGARINPRREVGGLDRSASCAQSAAASLRPLPQCVSIIGEIVAGRTRQLSRAGMFLLNPAGTGDPHTYAPIPTGSLPETYSASESPRANRRPLRGLQHGLVAGTSSRAPRAAGRRRRGQRKPPHLGKYRGSASFASNQPPGRGYRFVYDNGKHAPLFQTCALGGCGRDPGKEKPRG
jgi:hypothetical protein